MWLSWLVWWCGCVLTAAASAKWVAGPTWFRPRPLCVSSSCVLRWLEGRFEEEGRVLPTPRLVVLKLLPSSYVCQSKAAAAAACGWLAALDSRHFCAAAPTVIDTEARQQHTCGWRRAAQTLLPAAGASTLAWCHTFSCLLKLQPARLVLFRLEAAPRLVLSTRLMQGG